uniref:CD97 antigen-like n=1 Tax=Sinocyclocheilus grahami TaxID=75366 RepID=A0A672QNP4_SINGR
TDCGPNAKCINSEGGYNCTCQTGYISSNGKEIFNSGQGVHCIDRNECDDSSFCGKHATCHNTAGSFYCICAAGFRLKSGETNFTDIYKSCENRSFKMVHIDKSICGGGVCKNNKDGLECVCSSGFTNYGHKRMKCTGQSSLLKVHFVFVHQPGFTTAAFLSYKSLEKSLNSYFNHLETWQNQTFKINSKVVTATVSNNETTNLKKPVHLTFSHLEKKNEKHICVFWDHKLEGGAWSTRGCTTVSSSADQTVCFCSHLSSFAVLMALYDIGDVYELRLVTLVGLPLSLVCLLICIVTFYLVQSIQSTRNTIHLHLCISLFIAYFVFLVGITRTENKVGCAVVAGILHYFFLASFCWMCLEGVQLFRMVVLVFNTTLRPFYMFAAGYGVPAVIVAISATVNASGYGTDSYCWLNIKDGFIWSFYGPVCVIIIVNVFFFLITIWKLAEKCSSLNPDLSSLRKIKAFMVTAIAQLCILGIMWVFGCFQFDKGTLAMSYIFTILSSLQGVLMFFMHCWLSKQVREEYAKFLSCICAPQKRKYTEFSSNQTSKSQVNLVSKRNRLALVLRMCAH